MRTGSVQGQTMVLCLIAAAGVVIAATTAGQPLLGTALAAGLVVGSFNGFTIKAVLDRRAPILVTSILRLAFFSMVALVAVRLLGAPVWPVMVGLATAQLVMVFVGVRQGLRA